MNEQNDDNNAQDIQKFLHLFRSNTRSLGFFDPKNSRMRTEYRSLSAEDVEMHLAGITGVGCVPILDDGTCWWGAIDVDNHGSDEDTDIRAVAERIRDLGLPLVPCRSKSGGVHCYLFLKAPAPAAFIRAMLTKWAIEVGHAGAEIFPKQAKLAVNDKGERALGNWINLPYLGNDKTVRYAVDETGTPMSLREFFAMAEARTVAEDDIKSTAMRSMADAPPCVQRMVAEGVTQGHRNEALFQVTIYLKRAHPTDFVLEAERLNQVMFTRPLGRSEFKRTTESVAKKEYLYRCKEDPQRSLCDRAECVKRKFGISPEVLREMEDRENIPMFTDFVKHLTDPVKWDFKVDGRPIRGVISEDLLRWDRIEPLILAHLSRIVPTLKQSEWKRMLDDAIARGVTEVTAPEEASAAGELRARFADYVAKADIRSMQDKSKEMEYRKALTRGIPAVAWINDQRCIIFRGLDFKDYLSRIKFYSRESPWQVLKDLGVQHKMMRVQNDRGPIGVWYIPLTPENTPLFQKEAIDAPGFHSEI